MLTDAQKTDVRRHLKFPMYGDKNTVATGYRYWEMYGLLEYRMNHFSVEEESLVINLYLPSLSKIENNIFNDAIENLDTEQAAVWRHNKFEVQDKYRLYYQVCRALNRFIFATDEGTPLDAFLRRVWNV